MSQFSGAQLNTFVLDYSVNLDPSAVERNAKIETILFSPALFDTIYEDNVIANNSADEGELLAITRPIEPEYLLRFEFG